MTMKRISTNRKRSERKSNGVRFLRRNLGTYLGVPYQLLTILE